MNELLKHKRIINGLMAAAVVVLVAHTALRGTAEPWPWGAEASGLAYDASLAYATAWLFQWLVIVRPAEAQQRRMNEIAAPRLDAIIRLGFELADALRRQVNQSVGGFPVDEETVRKACASTTAREWVPGWDTSWNGLYRHLASESDRFRASLKPMYARLPDDVVALLDREEFAVAQIARNERAGRPFDLKHMNAFVVPINRWFEVIDELRGIREGGFAPEIAAPEPQITKPWIILPIEDSVSGKAENASLG